MKRKARWRMTHGFASTAMSSTAIPPQRSGCNALSVLNGSMRTVATASQCVTYVIPRWSVWHVYRSGVNLTFKNTSLIRVELCIVHVGSVVARIKDVSFHRGRPSLCCKYTLKRGRLWLTWLNENHEGATWEPDGGIFGTGFQRCPPVPPNHSFLCVYCQLTKLHETPGD